MAFVDNTIKIIDIKIISKTAFIHIVCVVRSVV
jgi:hypothetical protein